MQKYENYIVFKNKASYEVGLEIVEFPALIKPLRNFNEYNVAGVSGSLIEDLNTYSSYSLSIEMLKNPFHKNKASLRDISNWLDGSGELILSTEKDRKYIATVNNNIPLSNVIDVFPTFQVNFLVEPFRRKVNEYEVEIFNKTHFFNEGDFECNPTITIFGNGDINLIINDKTFKLTNVNDKITIDGELFAVYKDNSNEFKKYQSLDFPKFKKGDNKLDFNGNVKKIVIKPNTLYF